MAVYVFSDIHGHAAALRRALERIAPSEDDRFFCLGDMIDRGPDPIGVIETVRALPNVTVLRGNHEDLMLAWTHAPNDALAFADWSINGGRTTLLGMHELDSEQREELLAWAEALPFYAICTVSGRTYVLVHAGILPYVGEPRVWDEEALEGLLSASDPQNLMWVREEFWECSTGLLDEAGEGPIVVAGHTPTTYLSRMEAPTDRPAVDDDGVCQTVRVGDAAAHGGVYDKWNIDSGGAGGAGFGRITVIRLDDGEEFSEIILPGE